MNSKAVITIAYDGPAIDGVMDVRELAPALFEMGALLEDANRVLNGEDSKVNVLVKSDFRTGSFEIGLQILQSALETAKAVLELGRGIAVSAPELAIALGLAYSHGALGLLQVLKLLRGRQVKSRTVVASGNTLIYVEGEHNPIEVLKNAVPLLEDREVRLHLYGVIKPLEEPGIEQFVVREGNRNVETVSKSDRHYFAVPEPTEIERQRPEAEFTGLYHIVTTQFEEDLKWRLVQGENRITALLKDEEFLRKIADGEVSFTKGDMLEVRMKLLQWIDGGVLKTEYHIMKVIEHHKKQVHTQLHLLPEPQRDATES